MNPNGEAPPRISLPQGQPRVVERLGHLQIRLLPSYLSLGPSQWPAKPRFSIFQDLSPRLRPLRPLRLGSNAVSPPTRIPATLFDAIF